MRSHARLDGGSGTAVSGREEEIAGHRLANDRGQIGGVDRLLDEGDRTAGERGVDHGRIVAAREDDRLDRGVALSEQLEAAKAVHSGHPQVEERDVG